MDKGDILDELRRIRKRVPEWTKADFEDSEAANAEDGFADGLSYLNEQMAQARNMLDGVVEAIEVIPAPGLDWKDVAKYEPPNDGFPMHRIDVLLWNRGLGFALGTISSCLAVDGKRSIVVEARSYHGYTWEKYALIPHPEDVQ